MYGIHATGSRTRSFLLDNGVIRTDIGTFSTLNAKTLIYFRPAVCPVKGNAGLWTDFHTGVGKTALTAVSYKHPLLGTAVAGKLNHIDKWGSIVGLRPVSSLHIVGYLSVFTRISTGKSHSKSKTLSNYGPLKEYVTTKASYFTGNYLIRQFLDSLVSWPFCVVCHPGNLSKYTVSDFLDSCFNASH